MPQDYSDLNLNSKYQNVNSLPNKSNFVSSYEFQSQFDGAAVDTGLINRGQVFKLDDVSVLGTFTIGTNTRLTVASLITFTKRREIRPMLSLSDLYITSKDDTHIWNSYGLDGDLTADEGKTEFWSSFGKRENELNRNEIGVVYQITNNGTSSYNYFLDHTIGYVPVK